MVVAKRKAVNQLSEAEHHMRKVKANFHDALPHSFVDPELPRLMESSLQQVSQRLESIQGESEKIIQRFKTYISFLLRRRHVRCRRTQLGADGGGFRHHRQCSQRFDGSLSSHDDGRKPRCKIVGENHLLKWRGNVKKRITKVCETERFQQELALYQEVIHWDEDEFLSA